MPVRLPIPALYIEYLTNSTANFGPVALDGVIHDAVSVGWSWYSRFPANAFFTLRQESVHNARLVAGLSHIRIWYADPSTGYGPVLVFAGRLGDGDEAGRDVVWQAYSYLAELALSRTGYRVMYQSKKIGSKVVTDEWQRDDASGKFADYGATKQVKGLLRHVATGTIQDPQNAAGTADMRTDPQFGVISVPRLLLFYDLSEIGRANTDNNVTFEITRSTSPTFNFWKNRGSAITERKLTFPGIIRGFRFSRGVLNIRNDLATIGTKQGKAVLITDEKSGGTYGYDSFGRRQDTFSIKTLSGFKNLDTSAGKFSAQKMITERALKEAAREHRALQVEVPWHYMAPFAGWDIEDTIGVQISVGRTSISQSYRILGVRGRLDSRGYHQSLIVNPPDA